MEPIAITGIGCRFPRADGPRGYWDLLSRGVDAVGELPDDRRQVWQGLLAGALPPTRGGYLGDVNAFDPEFFGVAPHEAERLDPQHRLLLEVAWEALEDAGEVPSRSAEKRVGIFVGVMNADHALLHGHALDKMDAHLGTGSSLGIAANRLSYFFDFRGPSIAIDTLCSSSLVAVHLACRSLLADESTPFALACGVNIISHPAMQLFYAKAGLLSRSGQCRPFDGAAGGIVRGEGAGVVVLKRLSRALADGDSVYATIRASAVNQDGRSNGLTAPSRWSQEAVLREAYWAAGVSPGRVSYVEAHGTGTLIGDPIEAAALGAVLNEGRAAGRPCWIGSVKSNFGHLESAAGIAGLIKTTLALHHCAIAPSLHFESANPYIRFDELPLRVATASESWTDGDEKRIAGVSSFGLGGTNAHVVLESAPASQDAARDDPPYLLPLSAKNQESLRDSAERWLAELRVGTIEVRDAVFTASVRRTHHRARLAVVGDSARTLADELDGFLQNRPAGSSSSSSKLGSDRALWLRSEAARYMQGGDPDPARWGQDRGRVLRLPTYPFRRRHLSTGVAAEIAARRPGAPSSVDGLVYGIDWKVLVEASEPSLLVQTRWLIAADHGGLGNALADTLRAHGALCRVVTGDDVGPNGDATAGWRALLDHATDGHLPLSGVLYLLGLDAGTLDGMTAAQMWDATRSICDSARGLVQAIVAGGDARRARLWFVTRGSEQLANEVPSPIQAALAGMGRAIALEQPELWGRHLDLAIGEPIDSSAAAIAREVSTRSLETQIAFRDGERWVRRLSRRSIGSGTIRLRPDHTYLITGGLGGLGLLTARWLVKKGARHLVLLGRRGPGVAAREAIGEMERAGITVAVRSADIAQESHVARIIDEIRASMPPLAGIVHAAGVLADGFLYQQTWERFATALAPKVMGAFLLHEKTRHLGLDFFVLYSSVASMLGSPGQTNYAAGNAFLDALSRLRHGLGLPALSVNWGPWADAGMARDSTRGGLLGRFGLLTEASAFDALDRLLASGETQAGVMSVDWNALASESVAVRAAPVLTLLVQNDSRAVDGSLRARLANLPASARFDVIAEYLTREVARALGVAATEIEPERPLEQLGFDSMMALDVRVELEKVLGVKLESSTLVEASLRSLTELVVAAPASMGDAATPTTSTPQEVAPQSSRFAREAASPSPVSPWLVPVRATENPAMRLFCFPYAGGGAHVYRGWAQGLPDCVDIFAIQLPGRGHRRAEALLTSMDSIVESLVPELLALLDRPFAMFGHCLGAIVMFEAARRLIERFDKRPVELFASGCPAPQIYLIPHIYSQSSEKFASVLRLINFRSSEAIFQDESLLNLALPAVRADFEVASTYELRPPSPPVPDRLDVPITAFGAWEDLFAPLSAIEAWRERTTRSVSIYMRPGGHYFLETEQAFLKETVSSCLGVHLATSDPEAPLARSARSPFVVTPKPNPGAKLRLVCFPHVGADASVFRDWSEALPASVEVSAIELPGRGTRVSETRLTRIETIAEALVPELLALPKRPFVFFGHDMGAMIMLHAARILRARGAELPRLLVVSSAIAPHKNHLSPIYLLGDQQLRDILSFFGLPGDENLADLRADFEAVCAHRPAMTEPLPVPIVAYGALQDTLVPYGGMEAWSQYTTDTFSLIRVDGDHYHWSSDPGRANLLRRIAHLLETSDSTTGSVL